ncbi:MAG: FumA C-terminus/TtdB family hydratase beta subunit [Chloroflexi bacterium]|nr:FumA C-terminus/TtdB family hydratase beta subunit [Chloroflexota bacterium]
MNRAGAGAGGIKNLTTPLSEGDIRELKVGDSVSLNGVMITGRDRAHQWLYDTFLQKKCPPGEEDLRVYRAIEPILKDGILYHCGPVVSRLANGEYRFVAAGPTTSIREEPFQAEIMRHFGMKGVIGKGGMAEKTLQECREGPAVYFHAIGGAASLIAGSVRRVLAVHKLDFGIPEAIWVIEVRNFPVVVTMDSFGQSLHDRVRHSSKDELERLLERGY